MSDKIIILGGGIAGLSLAYFLEKESLILEARDEIGGLARSYNINGVYYDIGPHIIFSKNKDILDFINQISDNNLIQRSNQIYHKGNLIKYPFENFLIQLKDKEEINYCRNTFLNNPYKNMKADNMLAFFLKTFGEGITKLYLQPYNEKIWKFDPAMMDTQMVERIPCPPDEDIINSCEGKFKEGYLHQLYFNYPKSGGIFSLCKAFRDRIKNKAEIKLNCKAVRIAKEKELWKTETSTGDAYYSNRIINCMPLHELISCLDSVPGNIKQACSDLKFNSIYIVIVNIKKETIGNHFSVTFPQKDIIFHRLNRLNFLGENYCLQDGSSTLLLEITYRKDSIYSKMSKNEIIDRCIKDLVKLGFISKDDVNFTDIRSENYAYVIYDLDNKRNKELILSYLRSLGIENCGRFAEFEYLNSDQVIEHSKKLSDKINSKLKGMINDISSR